MSKIFGDDATIKAAKAAGPSDKTVFINWEAISEIPDQYEVIISKVEFDVNDLSLDFTNLGSEKKPSWYPQPKLMYDIAKKIGLLGDPNAIHEPIYEDIEIDEMNMTTTGMIIKKKVGYLVKKSSRVLTEDGTFRTSGQRASIENSWADCVKSWHKEEAATEGYSKVLNGEYTYYGKKVSGPHIFIQNGQYKNAVPMKFETKWKRKCHFDTMIEQAAGRADTKAHLKTIREVAGIPTGFTTEDLSNGFFIFSKVRRSKSILQAEAAAHLSAIASGNNKKPEQLLWADSDPVLIENDPNLEVVQEQETEEEQEPETEKFEDYEKEDSAKTRMLNALNNYDIPEEMQKTTNSMIEWLSSAKDPESQKNYWNKAIQNLKDIESDIPSEYHIDHKLY